MDSSPAAETADAKKPVAFVEELRDVLSRLEGKDLFVLLLIAWVLLFKFLGNSVLAYAHTYSIFDWCLNAYNGKDSDDSHGNLIPFVVLGLLWWKRKTLLAVPRKPWPWGLALLAGACFLHFLGYMLQVPHLSVLAFILGVYAVCGVTWGPAWLKATAFPFVLLIFCVPLAPLMDSLTLPLRVFATWITTGICHVVLGINVIRRGTQLIDPVGKFDFDVVAACSGIRSLVTLSAMTLIIAMVNLRSAWRRGVVFMCAFPLALGCNVLRLVTIILSTEVFGERAGHFVHEWFGFVTYIIALGGVLLVSNFLAEPTTPVEA